MSSDTNHRPEGDLPRSIGAPARRALAAAGYTRLAQLTAVSEAELLRLHGVDPAGAMLAVARQGAGAERVEWIEGDSSALKDGVPTRPRSPWRQDDRRAVVRPFERLARRGQVRRLALLAREALRAYDLDVRGLAPLSHGDNTTFRVDAVGGERFVLRIHRPSRKTPEVVRSELLWLAALQHEPDLAVPVPLPTRAGELLTVTSVPGVPEPRMAVLLRWLPGRFLDAGLTSTHLERVGAFIARLHELGGCFAPPGGGRPRAPPHPSSGVSRSLEVCAAVKRTG
jgi:hypothetical protein